MELEVKYIFDPINAHFIQSRINTIYRADDQFSQNIVNSMYFDTPTWNFSMEKASSDYVKNKVRVRWYSSNQRNNTTTRYLELKGKVGTRRIKARRQLAEEFHALNHQNCNFEHLLNVRKFSQELNPSCYYMNLVPGLSISYTRRRYVDHHTNSRISIDTNIYCYGLSNSLPMYRKKIKLDICVLEVKGNEESLPHMLRSELSGLIEKAAFSKYYESFKRLNHYDQ